MFLFQFMPSNGISVCSYTPVKLKCKIIPKTISHAQKFKQCNSEKCRQMSPWMPLLDRLGALSWNVFNYWSGITTRTLGCLSQHLLAPLSLSSHCRIRKAFIILPHLMETVWSWAEAVVVVTSIVPPALMKSTWNSKHIFCRILAWFRAAWQSSQLYQKSKYHYGCNFHIFTNNPARLQIDTISLTWCSCSQLKLPAPTILPTRKAWQNHDHYI